MNLLRQGSVLGESPYYVARSQRAHAPSLRKLLTLVGNGSPVIDRIGLRQYFDRRPDGVRTCFEATEILPAGCDLFDDDGRLDIRRRVLPDCPSTRRLSTHLLS